MGVAGSLSGSFQKYSEEFTGQHFSEEFQKAAFLGTAHVLWKQFI